jgi:hypothetical protein
MSGNQDHLQQDDSINYDEEEGDISQIVQYGIRRSRRDTSYEYRDSSSLSPVQMMDQELFYHIAEDAMLQSVLLLSIIVMVRNAHHRLRSLVRRWQRSADVGIANAVAAAHVKMQQWKDMMEKILLLLKWLMAYGEIALLYAEDLTIFVHRRNRFHPRCFQRIQDIGRRDCYSWFGLTTSNLERLFVHLRVPENFTTSSHHVYTGEECFIIFLYHMNKGVPFTDMARYPFGGDPRRFSEMKELMIDHLYMTFYHKISGRSLDQWIPAHLNTCRRLIYDALSTGAIEEIDYENGEVIDTRLIRHHFDFDSFRPFGFLDDFAIPTARPGISTRRVHDFQHDVQRAFYSGYLRRHGLNAQVVFLPIGIIGSVFITELRQNDNGVLNMSGLNEYLLELLHGIFVDGLFPALYCDGIFAVLATILPRFTNPTPELHLLNMRMASLRQCIEHVFGDHRTRFRIFSIPQYLHLFSNGVKVRRMCLVSFFILNCHYCIDGTRSTFFGHVAPTIEDYLPLDEELVPPPAVNLGLVWDYGGNGE